ncbi:hypothetical protein KCP70_00325 [Salmonella enterica subsp. enterica]|nr:hypothetical protein KCP70_00325 [Salmonella enterica subsp. enterica]
MHRHQCRLAGPGLIDHLPAAGDGCSLPGYVFQAVTHHMDKCIAGYGFAGRRCLSHPGSPSDHPHRQSGTIASIGKAGLHSGWCTGAASTRFIAHCCGIPARRGTQRHIRTAVMMFS